MVSPKTKSQIIIPRGDFAFLDLPEDSSPIGFFDMRFKIFIQELVAFAIGEVGKVQRVFVNGSFPCCPAPNVIVNGESV